MNANVGYFPVFEEVFVDEYVAKRVFHAKESYDLFNGNSDLALWSHNFLFLRSYDDGQSRESLFKVIHIIVFSRLHFFIRTTFKL